MKTLYFEGAGWFGADISKETDVGNCRIRTAFTNSKGDRFYLEIHCTKVDKHSPPSIREKGYNYVGFISDCFKIMNDKNGYYKQHIVSRNGVTLEYSKRGILAYVNNLDCDFDEIVVLPALAGYGVHKGHRGGYNNGDEFEYDRGLTERRERIYQHYYNLERSDGKRYPCFGLWVDEDDPKILHLMRYFTGHNKHWVMDASRDDWQDTVLRIPYSDPGGRGIAE